MTEKARVRLGAYFLFALLISALPVSLVVTHVDGLRSAPQWQASSTGVKRVNVDHRAQGVQFAQEAYGLSKRAAERFVSKHERETQTRLTTEREFPFGTQIDYISVDGSGPEEKVEFVGAGVVVEPASPAARAYLGQVNSLPDFKKKNPEVVHSLRAMLKKGFLLVPTSFTESLPIAAVGDVSWKKPRAVTQHRKVCIVATKLPGWRDAAPRSDGDNDPNDNQNISIDYLTGASLPAAALTEVVYRPTPRGATNNNSWNFADVQQGGTDELQAVSGSNPFGSIFDGPGGLCTAGIPTGIAAGDRWDYVDLATFPHSTRDTTLELRQYYFNLVYDQSLTSHSLSNMFYQQTHGNMRVDGDANDVIGWLFSAHQLNRYRYQDDGGNQFFVMPGTPVIRKVPDNNLPVSGGLPQANVIVRATLYNEGLTLLFSRPRTSLSASSINLQAYTSADVDLVTTGTQPGTVSINWTQTGTVTPIMDPYDGRRWFVPNAGGNTWKFTPTVNAATPQWPTWAGVADGGWSISIGGYSTMTDLNAAWSFKNNQQRGCPPLDNTIITKDDLQIAPNAADNASQTITFGERDLARLKSLDYYTHEYVPSQTFQLQHTRPFNTTDPAYYDDISGRTYNGSWGHPSTMPLVPQSVRNGDRVPRPYPFDHESDDPWNGGYWPRPGATNVNGMTQSMPPTVGNNTPNHSIGAYQADVERVLADSGISLAGYDVKIWINADGGATDDSEHVTSGFQPMSPALALGEAGGPIQHEMAHRILGAIDLYDNDLYANGLTVPPPVPRFRECAAMDIYSLMDRGGRLDAYHQEMNPAWTPIDVITKDTLGVQIPAVEGMLRDPVIIKVPGNPYYLCKDKQGGGSWGDWQEYFLLENRARNSADGGAYFKDTSPKGLYIYHIDKRNLALNNPLQAGFQRDDDYLTCIIEQADGLHELEFNLKGNSGNTARDPFGGGTACNVDRFWQFPYMDGDTNSLGQRVNIPTSGGMPGQSPTSFSHGYSYSERGGGGAPVVIPGTETDSFVRVVNISAIAETMTADIYVEPAELVATGSSLIPSIDISTADRAANVATIVTATPHGLSAGQAIVVSGVSAAAFNGMFTVTSAPTATSLTYALAGGVLAGVSGRVTTAAQQGQRNVGIMRLDLENPDGTANRTDYSKMSIKDVYLDSLDVLESGSSNNPLDIEAAKLFVDSNENGVFDVVGDTLLATRTLTGNFVQFRNLGYLLPLGETDTLFIVYDIAPEAQTNPRVSVGAEFTDARKIGPRLPGSVQALVRNPGEPYSFGASRFPIASNTSIIVGYPDALVLTPSTAGLPTKASQGQVDVPVMRIGAAVAPRVNSVGGSVRIDSIKVDAYKDVADTYMNAVSDLLNCKLYVDNGDGSFDVTGDSASTTALLGGVPNSTFTPQSLTNGRANFPNLNLQVQVDSPVVFWLSVTVAPGATLNRPLRLSMDFAGAGPQPQANCPVQLINNANEADANKDYVEWRVANGATWPMDSLDVIIIEPNNPPGAPQAPFAPSGNQQISDNTPTLSWGAAADVDAADTPATLHYEVLLANNAAFTSPIQGLTLDGVTSFDVATPLTLDQDYWWRVRAVDAQDAIGPWSADQRFRVVTNRPPAQITTGFSPFNQTITTLTPTIMWDKTTDPDASDLQNTLRYRIEVDNNDDFSSPEISWIGGADVNQYVVTAGDNLTWGTIYYYRVWALDQANAESLESPHIWFRPVNDRPPYTPIAAFAPSGGVEETTENPVLEWRMPATPDPDPQDTLANITYQVQVKVAPAPGQAADLSTGPYAFTANVPAPNPAVLPIRQPVTDNLQDNLQYFWRVRAVDPDDAEVFSAWSAVQNFFINTGNEAPLAPVAGFDPVNNATVNDTTPNLSWDNSPDPDPDPYDGAFTNALTPQTMGVTWIIDLSADNFVTVPYTYYVPAVNSAVNPVFTIPAHSPLTETLWYWRVRSVDDQGAQSPWSATRRFTVDAEANAPAAPSSGFAPAGSLNVSTVTPRLSWDAGSDLDPADVPAVLRYEVQVADSNTFPMSGTYYLFLGPTSNGQTYADIPAGTPLAEGDTYYWRVRTIDTTNLRSGWSGTQIFNVVTNTAPYVPITVSPISGVELSDPTPVLNWRYSVRPDPDLDDTPETMTYYVEVDDNSNFSSPEFAAAVTPPHADPANPTVEVTTPLNVGVRYYWRVRATDRKGLDGAWTTAPTDNFRIVANQAPNPPTLAAPIMVGGQEVEVTTATPLLRWNAATDPNASDTAATLRYELRLKDANDLSSGPYVWTYDSALAETQVNVAVALTDNTHYYWQVRTVDQGGLRSAWSAAGDFWVNTQNDAPTPPVAGFEPPTGTTTAAASPTLRWDNSVDPDPDPFDGATSAAPVVGVRWIVELSTAPAFGTIAFTYTTAAGTPSVANVGPLTDATTWYWRVRAMDDDGVQSINSAVQTLQVDTTRNAPATPTGLNPATNQSVSSTTPRLSWTAATDVDPADLPETLRYEVQVAEDQLFAMSPGYFWASAPTTAGIVFVDVPALNALDVDGIYYWRVRTVDQTNLRSAWSAGQRFTVVANRPPNQVVAGFAPAGGATVSDLTPRLSWQPATPPDPDADDTAETMRYYVTVDNNINFSSPEVPATLTTLPLDDPQNPYFEVPVALSVGVTYYWRVMAVDNEGLEAASWSPTQNFRTVPNVAPATPVGAFAPSGGVEVSPPVLSWNTPNPPIPPDANPSDSIDTIRYEVEVRDLADFAQGALIFSGTTPEGQSSIDVPNNVWTDNTHYFWRVRAIDRQGAQSAWTSILDFWVNTGNDVPLPPTNGFVPVNGAGITDTTPQLSWGPGSDSDATDLPATLRYQVQLSTSATMTPANYVLALTPAGVTQVVVGTALTDETTWYWQVRTIDDDGAESVWSAVQSFILDSSAHEPSAPASGFSPAGGGNVSNTTPTLRWDAGTDPDADDTPATLHYEVELSASPAFTNPVPVGGYYWSTATADGVTSAAVPAAQPLTAGVTYYWRVRTVDDGNLRSLTWSATQSFVIGANQPPNAVTGGFIPTGGTGISDATPLLSWNAASDPDADDIPATLRYIVVVDDTMDFSSPEYQRTTGQGVTEQECRPTTPLSEGTTYYWRVRTRDAGGLLSAWSTRQSFVLIRNRPPSVPATPYTPSGGSELNTANPTLQWTAPATPDPDPNDTIDTIRYQIQLNNVQDLASGPYLFEVTTAAGIQEAICTVNLLDNTQYWWRVRALDAGGLTSDWSAVQTFWINLLNQPPLEPTSGFSPANGQTVATTLPTLAWNAGVDPDPFDTPDTLRYIAELSLQANFSTVSYQYSTAVNTTQAVVTTALTDRTTWYWRVRTVDQFGAQSAWSAIQNFVIDIGNQQPVLSDPQVVPLYGDINTYYELFVTYTDAENDAPTWMRCEFGMGLVVNMTKVTPADNNARDGIRYVCGVAGSQLGLGGHSHVFSCQSDVSLAGTGPIIGVPSRVWFLTGAGVDADVYEEGSKIYVKVQDLDQNQDPAVTETVWVTISEAGGDSEAVELTETTPASGVFRGFVQSRGRAGAVNDGLLNVMSGGSGQPIFVTYTDPDDGTAPTPDVANDMALVVDTKAPAAVGAAVAMTSGIHGRTVNLDWSTYDENAQVDVAGYHVWYSTTDFDTLAGLTSAGTVPAGTQTFEVPDLTPNREYYFAVTAFDEVPNENTTVNARRLVTRDITAPTISGEMPTRGATEVARDTAISFYLDDPGVGVERGTLSVTLRQDGVIVPHNAPTFSGDKYRLQVTVQPTEELDWNATINVGIDVRDFDGNQLVVTDWEFETVTDVEAPVLEQETPSPNATNVPIGTNISFRARDAKSGIDFNRVEFLFDGQDFSSQLDWGANPNPGSAQATYDPPVDLLYNRTYTVSVTLYDVAGNTPGPVVWQFSTPVDGGSVAVDPVSPLADATDVPIDTNIVVRLSDTQAGVRVNTLRVWVQNLEIPAASLSLNPDNQDPAAVVEVTYDPPADLPYASNIPVRVYVKDAVDNETTRSYSFRTIDEPTYAVSGVVRDAEGTPIPGVTISAGGQTATSDGTGGYRVSGLPAGTYRVIATRDQYTFTTAEGVSDTVVLGPDDAALDFVGTLMTYSLTGRITEDGTGLAGVTVTCNGSTAVTAADGRYRIDGLPNGQYTVTPSLDNYTFQPPSRAAQISSANLGSVDFAAVATTFSVSGTVTDNVGNRVAGVQIACGEKLTVTNSAGVYVVSGLRAGTYELTATKLGYTMEPAKITVTLSDETGDLVGQDFAAFIEMATSFPAGANLIGVPGTPRAPAPMSVFGTGQVYRWNPDLTPERYMVAQNEPNADFLQVRPGRGYFVNFDSARTLSVAGTPTDPNRSVSIGLSEGWNMIANPLSMPLKFEKFIAAPAEAMRPFAFVYDNATGSYKMVAATATVGAERDSLLGWEGAWVRAVGSSVSVTVLPGSGLAANESMKPQQVNLAGGWTIPVVARAADRADFTSMAGVVPGSGEAHVVENPPAAPNTVDVYFTNAAGARLAHDIRSEAGAQTFSFSVACALADTNVTVSLPDLSRVPRDMQVTLLDKETGKSVYARTMQGYTYRSNGTMTVRDFDLIVSPRTVGTLAVTATCASASGSNVVVTYSVTKACDVSMRVLNMAGRCVRTLSTNRAVQAGVQTEVWNLSSDSGTRVPSGTYLLQIDASAENGQQVRGLTQVRVGR